MNPRVSAALVFLLAASSVGWSCDDGNPPAKNDPAANNAGGGGEVWEQVFGTWTCTADGRDDFTFDVNRKSQYGTLHEWVDHGTGAPLKAYVELTQLYLMGADDTSFRNFEYKTPNPDVLDHLDEWAQQAAPNTPYTCQKQ